MALSYSALRAASNAPRSAVISGGLGAIATATAKSLLRTQGYQQVYLLHPTFEDGKVEEVMANYTPEERRFLNPVSCDMLDESSVQARFAEMEIHSEHTLAVFVNAAGYVKLAPFEKESVESFRHQLEVNLVLPFIHSKAFCNELLKHPGPRHGRIILIASQAAHSALEGHVSYSAGKAGVLAMSRCIGSELANRGNICITTTTVSPTVVWTPLGMEAWKGPKGQAHMATIPTGRFCEVDEVAGTITYLAGQNAEMINGADVRIDGGFTCR